MSTSASRVSADSGVSNPTGPLVFRIFAGGVARSGVVATRRSWQAGILECEGRASTVSAPPS
jgi:hypothetical protein